MNDTTENTRQDPADIIPLAIRKLEKLRMKPPPPRLFDEPLGYTGTRRLFALYWLRSQRVPLLNDGLLETVGDPEPYRIWRYHPRVVSHLINYDLGDKTDSADHWLLVDRRLRVLYAGKTADVQAVLGFQKRGIIGPLAGAPSRPGKAVSMHLMGKVMTGSQRKLGRLLVPNLSVLHELESWIDGNVALF
jgi:hypothetical protein